MDGQPCSVSSQSLPCTYPQVKAYRCQLMVRTALSSRGMMNFQSPAGATWQFAAAAAAKSLQLCPTVSPHRRQLTRPQRPWDSPGKNTGAGCHFLLQCMKVKSESEVAQSCPTLSDPTDCSLPGSSVHGIFQARVLEWGVIAFSDLTV